MSINIKKKNLIIAVIIVISIIIIVTGIFLVKLNLTNMKIKETETKLSEIEVKELQNKIIEKLEETQININTRYKDQVVITEFVDNYENTNDFVTALILCVNRNNIYDGESVAIPLFKIEKDSKGNFKNIQYVYDKFKGIVKDAVESVLQEEYNIAVFVENNTRYNEHFRSYGEEEGLGVWATNERFLETVIMRITEEDEYYDSLTNIEYDIMKFGII